MKIIFECEWGTTRTGGVILTHKASDCRQIAWTDGEDCHIFYPEHIKLLCESIDDGKAKAIKHLRKAGVLVEGADVNAELLAACHTLVSIVEQLIPEESARGVADVVLAQGRYAIAKAEATL